MSRISSCLDAAHHFLLSRQAAITIVEYQVSAIGEHWHNICEEAELTPIDRNLLWGRQFLNPFAFDGLKGAHSTMVQRANQVRSGQRMDKSWSHIEARLRPF